MAGRSISIARRYITISMAGRFISIARRYITISVTLKMLWRLKL